MSNTRALVLFECYKHMRCLLVFLYIACDLLSFFFLLLRVGIDDLGAPFLFVFATLGYVNMEGLDSFRCGEKHFCHYIELFVCLTYQRRKGEKSKEGKPLLFFIKYWKGALQKSAKPKFTMKAKETKANCDCL